MAQEDKTQDSRPTPPKAGDRPSEKDLEKAADIRAQIAELAAKAAELEGAEVSDDGEIVASVVRNVPDFDVEVRPGNVVSQGDEDFYEGDSLAMDGPRAMALASLGHVEIKGVKSS
jgi:hypothetical protein